MEFDLGKNGEDKNKLCIAMRAALRLSRLAFGHKKPDFLMGVYVTRELKAFRLIVYQDGKVCIKPIIYSISIIYLSLSGVLLARGDV